jgi:hypothetical protein
MLRVADPLPEVGDTVSHGWSGVAVHVTAPAPLCNRMTNCKEVCDVNAPPVITAPKFRLVRFSDIVGGAVTVSIAALLVADPTMFVAIQR